MKKVIKESKALQEINKIDLLRRKKKYQSYLETEVDEDITSSGYSQLRKPVQGIAVALKDLLKGLQRQNDDVVIPEIEYIYEKAEELMKILQNKKYNESLKEGSYEEKQIMNQLKGGDLTLQIKSSKGKTNFLKLTPEAAKKIAKIMKTMIPESVNEGKYHDYRNDETLTPRQKIGHSMREVRNALSELNKLIDMNVRLKNELNVDSRSYWKNTHKALGKISERLVKLANKVGKLQ
jgi:methyl coenzyme M reductase subunit D